MNRGVDVGRNFGEVDRRVGVLQELSCAVSSPPEDEVIDAIEDAADELGQSFETVRGNVAYIMDSPFEEEGVSTSFNESIEGASLEHDEVGHRRPPSGSAELYKPASGYRCTRSRSTSRTGWRPSRSARTSTSSTRAERAGLELPHSCRNGMCTSVRASYRG